VGWFSSCHRFGTFDIQVELYLAENQHIQLFGFSTNIGMTFECTKGIEADF
jgi:hypothetical protein